MNLRWAAAAVLASAIVPAGAFTTVSRSSPAAVHPSTCASSSQSSPSASALRMGPPSDPTVPLTERFGEGSRKYRRTVYTHDAWVKHRSSDRFSNNLGTLLNSGIYKQVGREVGATTAVAAVVCGWNALAGGYEDLGGAMHDPLIGGAMVAGLPMEVFTIVSSSLGLLLTFRLNQSYKRWDEARKFWGLNINHTRDLNRMATAWYGKQTDLDGSDFMEDPLYPMATSQKEAEASGPVDPEEREELLGQVSLMTWAFVRSMKRHLSPPDEDEEDYVAEVTARMSEGQAAALLGAAHRPNRALYDLSVAIEKLPMHFARKDAINANLSIFEDTLGGSERLLSSPVPLFYSRHTARFLAAWLLLLPLGLYGPFAGSWNHVLMVPATAVISLFLFGIEELATQLEEPFTILPMQGFCDKIGANCDEIVSWAGQGSGEEEAEEEEAPTEGEQIAGLKREVARWRAEYEKVRADAADKIARLDDEIPAARERARLQVLEAMARMEEEKLAAQVEANASIDGLRAAFEGALEETQGTIAELREALGEKDEERHDEVVEAGDDAGKDAEAQVVVDAELEAATVKESSVADTMAEVEVEEVPQASSEAIPTDDSEDSAAEAAPALAEAIENRVRRRMSLRERLSQMDVAAKPAPAAAESTMEIVSNSDIAASKRSLSPRELVQMQGNPEAGLGEAATPDVARQEAEAVPIKNEVEESKAKAAEMEEALVAKKDVEAQLTEDAEVEAATVKEASVAEATAEVEVEKAHQASSEAILTGELEDAATEEAEAAPAVAEAIENRARRRMSLRERLSQMDVAAKPAPAAAEPKVETASKGDVAASKRSLSLKELAQMQGNTRF